MSTGSPPPTTAPAPRSPSPPSPTTKAPAPSPPTTSTPPPSVTPVLPPPPSSSTPTPPSTPSAPSPSPPVTSAPPPPLSPSSSPPSPPTNPSSSSPPPPAPPSSSSSPPPPRSNNGSKSPPSSPTTSSSSNGVPSAAIIGIAVAGVCALVVLVILIACCRKKKKRGYIPGQYYGDAPPHPHKDNYYGGPQHWQHNAPPPVDHVVKIPPSPSPPPPPVISARPPPPPPAFHPPPPPPPLPLSSGEDSSSGFSGSKQPLPPPPPGFTLGFSKSMFTYEDLATATNGFSQANLLGQGGFGYVYKGILPDGQVIAVKQLKIGGSQGEREFQAEVEIISRVHHRHLVSLVGYCISGSQRMLVYEFISNDTLESHLHRKGRPTMDWPTRLKIALGAARGLAYLHEDCHPRIIHRDIKSSNILLDANFEAKVADFGLAKLASDGFTHVSTRVMGTFGYLAPEYASSGKLTEKSDVFSFGVMLLEVITGRRPVDATQQFMDDSLVEWARPLLNRALEDGNLDALVDPRLQNRYNSNEMTRVVACAAACVRHSARRRPRMGQIVRALEGDASLSDLNEGVRPGHSTMYSSYESSDYDSSQYSEDMKKFRKMALGSQEYGSEYSGPTSEYGLNPSVSSSDYQQSRERESSIGRSYIPRPTGHRRNHSGISSEHHSSKEMDTLREL
eukprot:Gb_17682 [translate_table: standard]